MRKIKWTIISILFLAMAYSLLWFTITFTMSSAINNSFGGKANTITDFGKGDYNIRFDKAESDGFPFRMGIKITGLSEEGVSSLVTHDGLVFMGYDVLKQRFYMSYNGGSTAKPKPVESGFGTKIGGDFNFYINCPINLRVFSILMHPAERGIDLLNSTQSIKFIANNISAHDIVDQAAFIDGGSILFEFAVSNKPYYNNLEEFRSNPPSSYRLKTVAKMDKAISGRKIAVSSFIYGIIPDHPFDYALDVSLNTKAKSLGIREFLENMELKTNLCKFSTPYESSDCRIDIATRSSDDEKEMSMLVSGGGTICPDYYPKQINKYKALAQGIINDDSAPLALKNGMNSFLENPEKYLPSNTEEARVDFDLKLSLSEANNKMSLSLENLSFLVNDTGFRFSNKSIFNGLSDWQSSGLLSLSKYENLVDFDVNYIDQIWVGISNTDALMLRKDVRKKFLRAASNHPESSASDVFFDYEFDPKNISGKIVGRSIHELQALYNIMFYNSAIEIAKQSPDFNKSLEQTAPELLAKPDMLKSIMESK